MGVRELKGGKWGEGRERETHGQKDDVRELEMMRKGSTQRLMEKISENQGRGHVFIAVNVVLRNTFSIPKTKRAKTCWIEKISISSTVP